MRALAIIVPFLCIIAIAYRYYSAFIAAKVMSLDATRVTPAHRKYDGANDYTTSRWVPFRPRGARVGNVHDLHHDPARADHGLLHVPLAARTRAGGDHRRRHRPVSGGRLREERRRIVAERLVHPLEAPDRRRDGALHDGGV